MVKDSAALDAAAYKGSEAGKTGLHTLLKTDLFNLLCIPPDTREATPTRRSIRKRLTSASAAGRC